MNYLISVTFGSKASGHWFSSKADAISTLQLIYFLMGEPLELYKADKRSSNGWKKIAYISIDEHKLIVL